MVAALPKQTTKLELAPVAVLAGAVSGGLMAGGLHAIAGTTTKFARKVLHKLEASNLTENLLHFLL